MKKYCIVLILLLTVVCRLYHITFPVAGFAGWRQADTAAVARNFYENGFHLFSPQIDWGGNTGGYVEMEFPIYPYLISGLYYLSSPQDFWGRILSAAFALISVYALFLLVKKHVDENVALWAALIYAVIPLNVFYTRAVMPESMMLMSSVLGIYYFSEWTDRDGATTFLLAGFFVSLAILLKITCLYLGLPLLFLAWQKEGAKCLLNRKVWCFALLVLTPVVIWYYHAHRTYVSTGLTFGIWDYGSGKWGNFQPLLTFKFYNDILFKSIAERHLTYAGFIPFVIGLSLPRKRPSEYLFDWWLVAVIVYFGIVATGNQIHEYYQLPFMLPAVVYIGKTFNAFLHPSLMRVDSTKKRLSFWLAALCILSLPILSVLRLTSFMSGEQQDSSLFQLGNAVQQLTHPDDLVVAVDQGDPLILYRCNRKGWHAPASGIQREFLDNVATLGAKYLVGTKDYFDDEPSRNGLRELMARYTVKFNSDSYFILSLDQGQSR